MDALDPLSDADEAAGVGALRVVAHPVRLDVEEADAELRFEETPDVALAAPLRSDQQNQHRRAGSITRGRRAAQTALFAAFVRSTALEIGHNLNAAMGFLGKLERFEQEAR